MSAKNIAIRVDASNEIGTGHFMRCLTLADGLKEQGGQVYFLSRYLPEHLASMLLSKGHDLIKLGDGYCQEPDRTLAYSSWLGTSEEIDAQECIHQIENQYWEWLIVDHYGLDAKWESLMRRITRRIMVVDDLANRPHDCDLLLDQNCYDGYQSRYKDLVSNSTRCLLGAAYVLLRPEFSRIRKTLRKRDGSVRRVLVFFGGSDPTNQTLCALEGINALQKHDIAVDVVVGSVSSHRNEVLAYCKSMPTSHYYYQISNMAELIAAADLGIGAGGSAMWERCALGLPTLTVTIADNQVQATQDVAKTGAIVYLGSSGALSSADYANAIRAFLDRPDDLLYLSAKALELIDASNKGVEAVIRAMNEITSTKAIC